jgi:hypothetical protein
MCRVIDNLLLFPLPCVHAGKVSKKHRKLLQSKESLLAQHEARLKVRAETLGLLDSSRSPFLVSRESIYCK